MAAAYGGLTVGATQAATIAHWTFENAVDLPTNAVLPAADGFTPDAQQTGAFPGGPFTTNPNRDFIPDISGNNNRLLSFHAETSGSFSSNSPGTGFSWNVSTPASNGAARDLFETNQGIGAGNVRTAMNGAPNFTVEASFMQTSDIGFQAIVGRDRAAGDSGGGPLASFWLGVNAGDGAPGDLTENPRLHFYTWNPTGGLSITDPGQTGLPYFGVGPVIEPNVWYDAAVVGDGTLYSLYLKKSSEATYQLLFANVQAGLGTMTGGWTVGRGQFAGAPADGFKGFIDNVRISNSALTPDQFLGVPEPSSLVLLGIAAAGLAARRR